MPSMLSGILPVILFSPSHTSLRLERLDISLGKEPVILFLSAMINSKKNDMLKDVDVDPIHYT